MVKLIKWTRIEEGYPPIDEPVLCCCENTIQLTFKMGEKYLAIDQMREDLSWRTERLGYGKVLGWWPLPTFYEFTDEPLAMDYLSEDKK